MNNRITVIRLSLILMMALVLVMCKNHEKMSTLQPTTEMSRCKKLTSNTPGNTLFFAAKAESPRKKVASERAQQESIIKLVQFFQSQFIEDRQYDFFDDGSGVTKAMRQKNNAFRKHWSEVSFKMIGEKHNQKAFTHRQKILADSSDIFTVYNVLIISKDWIREHWKKSLAATNAALYKKATENKQFHDLMELKIHQKPPCEGL